MRKFHTPSPQRPHRMLPLLALPLLALAPLSAASRAAQAPAKAAPAPAVGVKLAVGVKRTPLSRAEKAAVTAGHSYIVRGSDGMYWFVHHHGTAPHVHHGIYRHRATGRLVYKEGDRWYFVPNVPIHR